MKSFFTPNIDSRGRFWRAVTALVLFIGAVIAFSFSRWLAALLLLSGAFVLFEAMRGWCALRACGIKTKL